MIFFDHVYTGDHGFRFLKKLEKFGFTLVPTTTEHPGRHFCRFIKFPAPETTRKAQYLEFVWGKARRVRHGGYCFGSSGKLERYQKKLERDGRYKSKLQHKNYDWKKDNKSRLPGWNFLTFQKLGLPGVNPWFTEYEPRPGQKPLPPPRHKNGAKRIHAFVFEVNPKGERFFAYILGRRILGEKARLGGVTLYFRKGKRTRIEAVAVEMRSLPAFLKRYGAKADGEGEFFGRRAVRIENPDRSLWDLILV